LPRRRSQISVKGTDGVTSVAGTATSVLFGIGATASEEIAASSWRRRRRRRRNDGGRGAGGESRWTWQFARQALVPHSSVRSEPTDAHSQCSTATSDPAAFSDKRADQAEFS